MLGGSVAEGRKEFGAGWSRIVGLTGQEETATQERWRRLKLGD